MSWLRANRVSVPDPLQSISYDLSLRSSVDTKVKKPKNQEVWSAQKIKSNPSFSLEKLSVKVPQKYKPTYTNIIKRKDLVKLPSLKKTSISDLNPQQSTTLDKDKKKQTFYQSVIYKALKNYETTYMMTLARQHFYQTIQALRMTKNIRLVSPRKQIKLQRKTPFKKTIYLDLDETLIHTDENSTRYSVKLTFPIQGGGTIQAGVRIRPRCKQFLVELAKFAQIIIFTASSPQYANVILNYLDPKGQLFSHRLYRPQCTIQRGYYIKDLRIVNRKLEDTVLVDNSAFSFALQPENGIPIIPFYHFAQDRELDALLQYLRELVTYDDVRQFVKKTFFFDAYIKDSNTEPRKIFQKNFIKQKERKIANGE